MRNLIDILDFSLTELDELIKVGVDIASNPQKYADKCRGKKLATLFFEPSTRTRLSFEAAMLELGGSVIGFSEANSSSAAKGESIADTAKIISCYADIIAMRSPVEGAPYVASINATIPVINAGDGGHHHPTQTLTDLLTIYREKGTLSGLTIGIVGDLKYGRTVHSLIAAMSRYENNKFILVSPDELKVPNYVKNDSKGKAEFIETCDLSEYMDKFDILYMTRIQRERFSDKDEYERLKDSYILTPDKLIPAKKDMRILHPLPRVNEISVKVDADERACYFRQALNGKFIRMALIIYLLSHSDGQPVEPIKGVVNEYKCTNPKCISAIEQELDHVYKKGEDGVYRCVYCDKE